MKRLIKFMAAGAIVAVSGGLVYAQQSGAPAAQTRQTQGQGGTAGTANSQQTQGQTGATYTGVSQTPWFSDKSVQSQLRLSGDQYNNLNKAYNDAWTGYNTNASQLGNNLTDQQRAQRMQERQAEFHQNFNKAAQGIFTDPQQQQRYNQLYLQYQGYGAFNDPMVQQKLNLTPDQRQKLNQYAQEWNQQMSTYHQNYQTDPQGTTSAYNNLRTQTNERLNSVLNDQQRQTWRQMTGDPYNFSASVYFQGNGAVKNQGQR